eukprot:m.454370 g.454370  ORF g.454370 m.454370 type:complete len:516 (+) comp20654_c0_seq1:156-1703(+)
MSTQVFLGTLIATLGVARGVGSGLLVGHRVADPILVVRSIAVLEERVVEEGEGDVRGEVDVRREGPGPLVGGGGVALAPHLLHPLRAVLPRRTVDPPRGVLFRPLGLEPGPPHVDHPNPAGHGLVPRDLAVDVAVLQVGQDGVLDSELGRRKHVAVHLGAPPGLEALVGRGVLWVLKQLKDLLGQLLPQRRDLLCVLAVDKVRHRHRVGDKIAGLLANVLLVEVGDQRIAVVKRRGGDRLALLDLGGDRANVLDQPVVGVNHHNHLFSRRGRALHKRCERGGLVVRRVPARERLALRGEGRDLPTVGHREVVLFGRCEEPGVPGLGVGLLVRVEEAVVVGIGLVRKVGRRLAGIHHVVRLRVVDIVRVGHAVESDHVWILAVGGDAAVLRADPRANGGLPHCARRVCEGSAAHVERRDGPLHRHLSRPAVHHLVRLDVVERGFAVGEVRAASVKAPGALVLGAVRGERERLPRAVLALVHIHRHVLREVLRVCSPHNVRAWVRPIASGFAPRFGL